MNNVVDAVIEIPFKTKNKFEIDKKTNRIKLDRVLYSAMNYPAEYGYIENTLAKDGDPLDILVISSEPTLSDFTLEEIKNFFQNYKTLQNIEVKVYDYHDTLEALKLIEESRKRYEVEKNA